MSDLFSDVTEKPVWSEHLGPGSVLLHAFALQAVDAVYSDVQQVIQQSKLRQMVTAGGYQMSVSTTNCGELGWVSDLKGYRYERLDPLTGLPWQPMPESLERLAKQAAEAAGYPGFEPDASLINRYDVGCKMSLHQDKNEKDYRWPVVSLSLGLPAIFMFGGDERSDKYSNILLEHGDIMVWGGPDRMRFHGVKQVKPGEHPLCGQTRMNLTWRKAG